MPSKNRHSSGRHNANSTVAWPVPGARRASELVGDRIDDPIEEVADLAGAAAVGGPADDEQGDDRGTEHHECVFRGGLASITIVSGSRRVVGR